MEAVNVIAVAPSLSAILDGLTTRLTAGVASSSVSVMVADVLTSECFAGDGNDFIYLVFRVVNRREGKCCVFNYSRRQLCGGRG